jgi:hypothetical protein
MKTFLIFSLSLGTFMVQAQTNFFPFLNCTSNVVYTNATIISVTPAFADVDFDGGIARVPLGNLPDFLQQRYHYDPANAAQFAVQEKAREAARKLAIAKAAAEQARLDALNVGPVCTLEVESVIDDSLGYTKVAVTSMNGGGATPDVPSQILMKNFPDSIRQMYAAIDRQQAAIDNLINQKITATATVNDPNDPDPGFTAQMNAQDALQNALEAKRDKLDAMQSQLKNMQDAVEGHNEVKAHFTGRSYGGFQIWTCEN